MIKKDNKEGRPSYLKKMKKIMSSMAVVTLLLPNVVSVGIASAEELKSEEPKIEETVIDSEEESNTIEQPLVEEDIETEDEILEVEEIVEEDEGLVDDPVESATYEVNEFDDSEEKADSSEEVEVYAEETFTVTIDPNGGTINDEYATAEVEEGEIYNLPHYKIKLGLFKTGHTVTGYTVEGTLLNADGEAVTEIPTYGTRDYTLGSNVTLTANWEVTTGDFTLVLRDESADVGKYTVDFTNLDNGIVESFPEPYVDPGTRVQWKREKMPYGTYNISIDGFKIQEINFRGWNYDEMTPPVVNDDGTVTLYLEYEEGYPANHATLEVKGETIPATNTVTIDPNGGEINEDYATAEVEEGGIYTPPAIFRSDLARPGYTLTGYTVEGTLLDKDGNEVTEISTFERDYTPVTDVTLKANWEETRGKFIIELYDDAPGTQKDRYTVVLVSEDGTEYPLTSNQYGADHRTWKVENVPNGVYSLVINGFIISEGEKRGQPGTTSSFEVTDNGRATADLEFADNNITTFIRYQVYGEPEPEIETHLLGLEVRDLDNVRTSDVGVEVTNEDGDVFTGTYNQYKQWFSNNELPEGTYTITLTTPEGTVAESNDTVASQYAVATDKENVFTIEVNAENKGNLSAVFGAFRLVEVDEATYQLGVEVRGLNDKRTDVVDVVVTNEEGGVFSGSYNQYLQWLTDEELPEGLYTITLTTPEGTVAEINDTTDQYAVATDEENVFTILLNNENLGYSSSIYGAFRLVKIDEDGEEPEEPTDPEEPADPEKPEDQEDPSDPEDSEDSETPDDKKEEDSEKLPQTGIANVSIGLGFASILAGLGVMGINKKRKK